jgi:exonuclease III
MKITTWNVNGYRAVLKKGFGDWLQQDMSDVICLQEIKSRPEQVEEVYRSWEGRWILVSDWMTTGSMTRDALSGCDSQT